ncbi:hypothetical protein KP509_1Z157500 [Ceratopteris richardii]|nr:hypothetical protein KP509_1Z157500 [Ceratopteris richardii]
MSSKPLKNGAAAATTTTATIAAAALPSPPPAPTGHCGAAPQTKSVAFKLSPSAKSAEDSCKMSSGTFTGTSHTKGPAPAFSSSSSSAISHAHSIMRVGPRLRAEGLMVPPASDAATLRRQVAALQVDLEAHIDGEHRLQTINQQLRERLELYMKQNHENVERAEKELNALHEDMEQTLELQRRLAQRATTLEKEKKELEQALQRSVQEFEAERSALQCKIASLTNDLHARADAEAKVLSIQAELERTLEAKTHLEEEIQRSCFEAEALKRTADEYSRELQSLLAKERLNQAVEKHSRRPLLRRIFYALRDAVERNRTRKLFDQAAEAFASMNCGRHGLNALQLATLRSKWMRQAKERQSKACMQDVWRAWSLVMLADKKYHDALERRKKSCLHKALCRWQSTLGMGRLSIEDERQLTELARMFWRNCIFRKVFKSWIWWIEFLSKPRKSRLKGACNHLNRLTMRQGIAAWRYFIRLARARRLKMQQACCIERSWCQRRFLNRWRDGILVLKYEKLLMEKALQFRIFSSLRVAVKSWLKFMQMRRHKRTLQALAFRHYIWSLQTKARQ